jgi:acyl carrier protein
MDLALFVEDEYGVRLDDTELNGEAFDTLGQLEALIEGRRR